MIGGEKRDRTEASFCFPCPQQYRVIALPKQKKGDSHVYWSSNQPKLTFKKDHRSEKNLEKYHLVLRVGHIPKLNISWDASTQLL